MGARDEKTTRPFMKKTTAAAEEPTAKKTKERKTVKGSEALILSLLEEKVDTVFGYPGGQIMPVYDALFDYQDRIRHILVRHEQCAGHAAQAYAQTSGKTGVCLATSGPGATNLITGIANAHGDSIPMVFITGQVPSHLLGKDAFQETDIVGLSMPVTKWNYQVTKAAEIPKALAKAFVVANTGRKGPVLIDVASNAQNEECVFEYERFPPIRSYNPYPRMQIHKVEQAAELINAARKPLLLAGHGVLLANCVNEVVQLSERAGIPVACTLLGLSAFPVDHPNYVGMLGMHGNYGPNIKTNEADVLIAVGMRFDDRVTGDPARYAPQAQVIHIEIDAAEIDKNVKTAVAVHSDARSAVNALLRYVKPNAHASWLKEFRACDREEFEKVVQSECHPASGPIRMGEIVRRLSEKTDGRAIVVTDVGQQQMIAARYYRHKHPNHFLTSGGLGTMGFGLPAAIGAKIGAPDKEVVMIAGDGGFQMTLQELGTIAQEGIAVKMMVFNNNFLGMVRQWQELFYKRRYSGTHMATPDFVAIAKAYGIQGERTAERGQLDAALDRMLDCKQSYLLEIMVDNEGNIFPMVPPGASVSDIRLE
jgi:acetolactate synthase I/II/III large subunit